MELNLSQLLVQIFIVIIIVGGGYSLWKTTRVYGGKIGSGLKWIGSGMLVFAVESLDQVLGPLSVVKSISVENADDIHRLLLGLGLLLAAVGFSKLRRIAAGSK